MDKTERFVTDYIDNTDLYYLKNTEKLVSLNSIESPLDAKDVFFLKVNSITFEEKAPRREALENVLSSMRLPYINFIYLIKGERNRISFYYGVSRDLSASSKDSVNVHNIGVSVLKRSIESNFRGSIVSVVGNEEKQIILNDLHRFSYVNYLEGVPGQNTDNAEEFQRVDRLTDVMLGDEFMFLVTSKALHLDAIQAIEDRVFDFYQKLVPASKKTIQTGNSEGFTQTKTETKGTTNGYSSSKQEGSSESKTIGSSDGGTSKSKSFSKTDSTTVGTNKSETRGQSTSTSDNLSDANGKSKTQSDSTSLEVVNKKVQDWMRYIDESILKRIDYGKGKGIFASSIVLFANDNIVMQKLANTSTTLFSGATGNKIPLQLNSLNNNHQRQNLHRNLQLPIGTFHKPLQQNEVSTRSALSQYTTSDRIYLANWYSINELGVIAGLPQKEVVGLSLNEEVEFGLNYASPANDEYKIPIGHLVQSGTIHHDIEISLDKKELSKHIFVCGVTGSGKTTTCMSILLKSNLPYLVIEPAKTEYRALATREKDLIVFTLGRDDISPFRLNPLEFFPSETISSHIDMIKASIEAAFDMEAAIPQIIEASLYECYKRYGWNIQTNKNELYDDPFADGIYAFPTLSDLISTTKIVVEKQGFDDRLKNDYLGSIKARLMGLVVGAKGEMLNTRRSIDFRDLLHHKVIIELENIRSGSEKSLIMGFILSNLNEAIKNQHKIDKTFKHITLVEEAHRLLSKYTPGDSLNKKNGVETFADMLAEIRKYGESLIIADQIPDKMTPDVLKNTNTKIVHKVFAQDDKEAIGNTISLTQEQKSFLSHLVTGRAIVFSQGWEKSIQVQIQQLFDTTSSSIDDCNLRNIVMNYYRENYKRGIIPELSCLKDVPNPHKVSQCFSLIPTMQKMAMFYYLFLNNICDKQKIRFKQWADSLKKLSKTYSCEELAAYLNFIVYHNPDIESEKLLYSLVQSACEDNITIDEVFIEKYDIIINQKSKNKLCLEFSPQF